MIGKNLNSEIFGVLKKKFSDLKTSFSQKIEFQKGVCEEYIISKGHMYNVFPYEVERMGYKLNGKRKDKLEMKDSFFRYGFDSQGKIRIIENASKFLNEIHHFEVYDYEENAIYSYVCNSGNVINVGFTKMNGKKVEERYTYATQGIRYEQYIYDSERLTKIYIEQKSHSNDAINEEWNSFIYSETGKLLLIQRECSNGYTENRYADKKINWKEIRENIQSDFNRYLSEIYSIYGGDKVTKLGISLFISDLSPIIMLSFDTEKTENELIGDWSHCYNKEIKVTELPLDESQREKTRKIVAEILIELLEKQIGKSVRIAFWEEDLNLISCEKLKYRKIFKDYLNMFYI